MCFPLLTLDEMHFYISGFSAGAAIDLRRIFNFPMPFGPFVFYNEKDPFAWTAHCSNR